MNSLISKHQVIADLIGKREISYTDIPVYNNIGDLLIMLGTIKFFNKYGINLKEVSSVYNFDGKNIATKDVIVLQGGGNLGDLYPLHQKFRELIISSYPNNRIIILPQTIYFESKKNYQKCCELFSKHNDLHIFVRDELSYELALRMSRYVYLAPDMAHQLYPIIYTYKNNKKVLLIDRRDKEGSAYNLDIKPNIATDWNILLKNHNILTKVFTKAFQVTSKLKLNFLLSHILSTLWIAYSKVLVGKAVKLFAKYEIIITNRLHGHILACLMDKKNIVYDNSYGKNSLYIKLWTRDSELVTFRRNGE